jgi:hypothetical protein
VPSIESITRLSGSNGSLPSDNRIMPTKHIYDPVIQLIWQYKWEAGKSVYHILKATDAYGIERSTETTVLIIQKLSFTSPISSRELKNKSLGLMELHSSPSLNSIFKAPTKLIGNRSLMRNQSTQMMIEMLSTSKSRYKT